MKPGDVQVNVAYAVVVPPDCPDWRTSPVTTYSNTMQGNFQCSQVVNTGLMVADPHDLVRGTGDVQNDTEVPVKAIENYQAGIVPTASSGSSSGTSTSGSATASAPTGPTTSPSP